MVEQRIHWTETFQTPERGTRVSRPVACRHWRWMPGMRFKPLNGEPGCRDHPLARLDELGEEFQTPERGTRVSRPKLVIADLASANRFKPLNGEPGCRDVDCDGDPIFVLLVFQTPERGTRVSRPEVVHGRRSPVCQFQTPERGTRVSRLHGINILCESPAKFQTPERGTRVSRLFL